MFSSRAYVDTGRLSFVLIVGLALLGALLSENWLFPMTLAIAFAMAAIGADLCSGYAGQPNIGQAFFMGLGAYTTALLTRGETPMPYLLVLVISAAVGAGGAAVVGIAAAKLGHLGFAVMTFMLSYVGFTLMGGHMLESLTNSASGLVVMPATVVGILRLDDERTLYFFALVLLALIAYVSHSYVASPAGRAAMMIKENDRVADVLGIPSTMAKVRIFSLSAAFAAIGGSILAEATGYVSPDNFEPLNSVLIFGMAAVGGAGTIAGPIIGAFFFRMFPELFHGLDDYSQIVFSVLFLLVLIVFPGGGYVILRSALTGVHSLRMALDRMRLPAWIGRVASPPGSGPRPPGIPALAASSGVPTRRPRPGRRQRDEHDDPGGLAVSTIELSAHFSGVVALDRVSITVRAGSCHALVGPNGAGKTTLLNCLSGLVPGYDGEIRLDGQLVPGLGPVSVCRAGVGRTFQHPCVVPELDATHNVMIGLESLLPRSWSNLGVLPRWVTGARREQVAQEAMSALDMVGFPADRRCVEAANLSYGELKLLELARVIVGRPTLLLLDEPTSGLASSDVPDVATMLRRLHRELAVTVILVSHDTSFVREVADTMTVLGSGTVLAEGTPDEVLSSPVVVDAFLGVEHGV